MFPEAQPALLAAGGILFCLLLWRLRKRDRRYSPARRADKILNALHDEQDIRIVYWSKSKRRFVKEIVTPESLNNGYMKAHDHARGITRKFKVARIKNVVVLPHPARGSAAIPEEETPRSVRVMILALLLVVVALLYWLYRDVERTDFTFRDALESTPRIELTKRYSTFTNTAPSQAEEKTRSEGVSDPETNRTEARLFDIQLKSSRGYYEQALALSPHGDFGGVIEYCTKAIRSDPYYAQAYCLRALGRIMKGDTDGAINDCSRAIELNPRYSQAYYIRGGALDEKGDSEAAIADYTVAVKINPQFPDAYNARAWARYRRGELDQAIEDVNQAISLNPNSANAYDTRGWTEYVRGNKDAALADCSRAVQLDPQSAVGYNSQGLLYFIVGNYREAVTAWDKVIEMTPTAKNQLDPWIENARMHLVK